MSVSSGAKTIGWKVYIGPVLFFIGIAVSIAGLITQLGQASEPLHLVASVFAAINLVWILMEAPITLRRPSAPPREVRTLVAYGAIRISTVGAALLGPIAWPNLSAFLVVPVLIYLAGVVLRTVAMRTLGRFYSHHVIRRDDHAIIQSGPYRIIRHPAYSGMLLGHIGLVLFFLNWASVVLLIALAGVISWRIRVEERELLVLADYRRYAAGRPRLIPGVW
jgi:protein-S-isoprenylcysteine O-methyltransferase Ste14